MNDIVVGLASGIISGVVYALSGFAANKREFDDDFDLTLLPETVFYGALVGLASVAFGLTPTEADAWLMQVGGIYLIKKLKRAIFRG